MTTRRSEAPPIDVARVVELGWWDKFVPDHASGCWVWQPSVGSHGYGQAWDGRTVRVAHRVMWAVMFGQIPDRLTVDHACRNRLCVNPTHLRLMSNVENARNNGQRTRTQCPQGHAYTDENTRRDYRGWRYCRLCQRLARAS